MKSCTRTPKNRKMARKRPRVGEIGRESSQKDEESMRNLKKSTPRAGKRHSGVFFALSVFCFEGGILFEISRGRRIVFSYLFACTFFVSICWCFAFFVRLPYFHEGSEFHRAGMRRPELHRLSAGASRPALEWASRSPTPCP